MKYWKNSELLFSRALERTERNVFALHNLASSQLAGGKIDQETRLYNADKDETRSMRSKEDAHDYRYFPDPDLLPLELSGAYIDGIKAKLPELPDQKRARFKQRQTQKPGAKAGGPPPSAGPVRPGRPSAARRPRTNRRPPKPGR